MSNNKYSGRVSKIPGEYHVAEPGKFKGKMVAKSSLKLQSDETAIIFALIDPESWSVGQKKFFNKVSIKDFLKYLRNNNNSISDDLGSNLITEYDDIVGGPTRIITYGPDLVSKVEDLLNEHMRNNRSLPPIIDLDTEPTNEDVLDALGDIE